MAHMKKIEGRGPVPAPPTGAQMYHATFCPEDGPDVAIDEDGCCVTCGATAIGAAADGLKEALDRAEHREVHLPTLRAALWSDEILAKACGRGFSPTAIVERVVELVREAQP